MSRHLGSIFFSPAPLPQIFAKATIGKVAQQEKQNVALQQNQNCIAKKTKSCTATNRNLHCKKRQKVALQRKYLAKTPLFGSNRGVLGKKLHCNFFFLHRSVWFPARLSLATTWCVLERRRQAEVPPSNTSSCHTSCLLLREVALAERANVYGLGCLRNFLGLRPSGVLQVGIGARRAAD